MDLKLRSCVLALVCIWTLGVAGHVLTQPTAPTASKPFLAKDAKEAMDFPATWARITSGDA